MAEKKYILCHRSASGISCALSNDGKLLEHIDTISPSSPLIERSLINFNKREDEIFRASRCELTGLMSVLVLIDGKNELYIYRGMKKVNSVGVGSGDAWQARFIDAERVMDYWKEFPRCSCSLLCVYRREFSEVYLCKGKSMLFGYRYQP